MQFIRVQDSHPEHEPFNIVDVTHNGETVQWDLLKFYGKPTNITIESAFRLINGYFNSLPHTRQQKIFDCFRAAKACFNIIQPQVLHKELSSVVKRLYDEIPFDDVAHWVRTYGEIKIPPSIKNRYEELEISDRDQIGTDYKSRTYLRDDYLELIFLAVYLKPMVPIWAEYARLLEQVNNSNSFREYQAMSLVSLVGLSQIPAYAQLRNYVSELASDNKSADSKSQISSVLGGVGSSELPDWLMSIVTIRKLVVIELSSYADADNIVSVVYHHVRNTIKSIDRKFVGRVKNKTKPSGSEEEDSKSVIETYKIKEEISIGDLTTLAIYAEDTIRVARDLSPDIPMELVEAFYEANMSRSKPLQPVRAQLVMLSWIMSLAGLERSVGNVNYKGLISYMSAAQALLWQNGYRDIAMILTADQTRDHDGRLLGGVDTKNRIPKEYVDKFVQTHPHYQERGSKERERQTNVVCIAVDNIAKELIVCDWRVRHLPVEYLDLMENVDHVGILRVPADIRTQLSAVITSIIGE